MLPRVLSCVLVLGICQCQPDPPRQPPPPVGSTRPTSTPAVESDPEPWPCAAQADVDGDGAADHASLSSAAAEVRTAKHTLRLPLPAPAIARLCLGDLSGNGRAEVVVSVVRPTSSQQTFQPRLFVFAAERDRLRPVFLGSRGAGRLEHFGLSDLDGDGRVEILARERAEGRERTRVYRWTGYELEENAGLADGAPPYDFGRTKLRRPWLGGRITPAPVLGSWRLSFRRTPAAVTPIPAGAALARAVNRGKYRWLNAPARRQLRQDGFVVVQPTVAPAQVHSLYVQNQYEALPSYVTADAALHLTHLVLDDLLQHAEQELLGPVLQRLVEDMHRQALRWLEQVPGSLRPSLERIALSLEVARAVLEGEPADPLGPRAAAIDRELAAMDRAAGLSPALAGLDYSDFVVRGHYTRSEALGRYFRAHLLLSSRAAADGVEAALWTALAVSDPVQLERLALLDRFARAVVGPPASETPLAVLARARATFGERPGWTELGAAGRWLSAAPGLSGQPLAGALTLLARRWPADNDLLTLDPDRGGLPDPLELFAALGSERAERRLASSLAAEPARRAALERASEAVRRGRLGDSASVGGRLLLSLRWLLLPYPEGYPAYQRSEAWSDHNLVTVGASWAEWRRDTILHVQPPVIWLEGGDEDALPPGKAGFVEPVPELYAELADLLDAMGSALQPAGMPQSGPPSRGRRVRPALRTLSEARQLLRFLETAARLQLTGQGLSAEQHEKLSGIGPWLERVLAGDGRLRLPPTPIVADVSTLKDPAGRVPDAVLTVGTGPLDVLVVAVPLGRRVVLARGAVQSFYAFAATGPTTDEQWRARLARGQAPPPPAWSRRVPLSGRAGRASGPRRKGNGHGRQRH